VTRTLVCIAFFLASGKQAAYVDLTIPAKTQDINTNTIYRHTGGRVFDRRGPDPQTLPLSAKVTRVLSSTENGPGTDSLEVVLTNIGAKEVTVPIGNDPVLILAPYAADRREVTFMVFAGTGAHETVGWVKSVSSAAYPDSVAHLAPGDSVTYKLPIDGQRANKTRAAHDGATLQLTVWAQFGKVVIDAGSDLHVDVGEEIRSENSLPWPPK